MHKANQRHRLLRSALTVAVIAVALLVLVLSVAVVSGAGHAVDRIALALPIFFVLLFLASVEEWLPLKNLFIQAEPRLSLSPTRAPPA